jgi:Tfp pilus assembly protein PilN
MSVRINLLPQEAADRQALQRQKMLLVLGGVVVAAALGTTTLWQNGRIADAEHRLAGEEEVLADLQREVVKLDEFADLDDDVEASTELIRQAMAAETSVAGILQDVAAVTPSDAEFETLTVTVAPVLPVAGQETVPIGTLSATGRSASGHAPGVERLLLEFDKVAGFHDPFLTNSMLEEVDDPYPKFSLEAQLGPEVLTGRYADGIPEELR